MAERLIPQTPDLEVHFVSLHPGVLMGNGDILMGVHCDGLESRPGGSSNTHRYASC